MLAVSGGALREWLRCAACCKSRTRCSGTFERAAPLSKCTATGQLQCAHTACSCALQSPPFLPTMATAAEVLAGAAATPSSPFAGTVTGVASRVDRVHVDGMVRGSAGTQALHWCCMPPSHPSHACRCC